MLLRGVGLWMTENNRETISMDVVCMIPALAEGSGGHRTILSNLTAVADRGAGVTLLAERTRRNLDAELAIAESLVPGASSRFTWSLGWDQTASCDIALATSAVSVQPLRKNVYAGQYAYFVQDWESWFNPMGDGYLSAEFSYLMDWRFITIGDWLRYRLLAMDPSRTVGSVHFGVDADLSRLLSPVYRDPAPIAVNWQPDKSRRCADLTLAIVDELNAIRPDIPVLLFGSDATLPTGNYHNLGILSEPQMLDLFVSAACVVHMSSSNPSRIPFEATACATPTVEFFGESTCFDFPRASVITVIPTVPEMVDAVVQVYENPARYAPAAASELPFLRSRDDERQRFAHLLLNPSEGDGAALPNRSRPDLVSDGESEANHRYVQDVQARIGVGV